MNKQEKIEKVVDFSKIQSRLWFKRKILEILSEMTSEDCPMSTNEIRDVLKRRFHSASAQEKVWGKAKAILENMLEEGEIKYKRIYKGINYKSYHYGYYLEDDTKVSKS